MVTSVPPGDLPALLQKPKALHRGHKEKVKVISGWTNNSKMHVLQATEMQHNLPRSCALRNHGLLAQNPAHDCVAPAIIYTKK